MKITLDILPYQGGLNLFIHSQHPADYTHLTKMAAIMLTITGNHVDCELVNNFLNENVPSFYKTYPEYYPALI